MRPPSDYAPPDAPIRRPIDLPDDFGTDSAADRRTAVWVAAALVATFAVASMLLMGAFN